ncbi:MAG: sulfurtransferase TusA family protein [Proteobacteria bacterium]|nr:sulfurtransferase TusA family protein [Pseudomonadota bacterium]MBU1709005.1 sulfurtransferase TusA family protein [Pseudomonadota bacterium]
MNIDSIKADDVLDTKGLSCPMPLLKTKKAIGKMEAGQILEVVGTDPGSKNDLPGWCERTGHKYLGVREEEGFFRFYIQKG